MCFLWVYVYTQEYLCIEYDPLFPPFTPKVYDL